MTTPIKLLGIAAFFLTSFVGAHVRAGTGTIPLEKYLAQVRGSNDGYNGSILSRQAELTGSAKAYLPFYTQFFTNLQYTDDNRQTLVPSFQGTRTITDYGQLGFKKLFDFGLQSQVSYGVTSASILGVNPLFVPQNNLVTSALTLQLTQSFWQNGFGKLDRAVRESSEAQDLANAYNSSYQSKTILADAESRYWALAVAREIVRVQKESTERTIAIRDFNARRVRSNLIDEADLLTSNAQAKARQFDLQTAIDNERAAARAFNSARGIDSDEVTERLVLPRPEAIERLALPVRAAMRDDVKAAEQTRVAVTASTEAEKQRELPSLNLVGTASTNGMDPSLGNSIGDTVTAQYPYYSVGVNFSMPLDVLELNRLKGAYADQMRGAELTYRRRLFEQENDWRDLVKKFNEAKARLAIAVDVEKAQKLKLQHEEVRHKQGATTTYQVFQFQLDYLTAVLTRLQTQSTILGLAAQMKTFGGDQ